MDCISSLYGLAKYGKSKYSIMCLTSNGTARILSSQGKKMFNIESTLINKNELQGDN